MTDLLTDKEFLLDEKIIINLGTGNCSNTFKALHYFIMNSLHVTKKLCFFYTTCNNYQLLETSSKVPVVLKCDIERSGK